MNKIKALGRDIYNCLYLDRRSLVLFRVLLGLLLLLDLFLRAVDLSMFYTDAGVLPSTAWDAIYANWFQWSFHTYFKTKFSVACLFIIEGFVLFAFIAGWRIRMMNVLLLIIHFSLFNRNYLVNNAGDNLAILLLYGTLFYLLHVKMNSKSLSIYL